MSKYLLLILGLSSLLWGIASFGLAYFCNDNATSNTLCATCFGDSPYKSNGVIFGIIGVGLTSLSYHLKVKASKAKARGLAHQRYNDATNTCSNTNIKEIKSGLSQLKLLAEDEPDFKKMVVEYLCSWIKERSPNNAHQKKAISEIMCAIDVLKSIYDDKLRKRIKKTSNKIQYDDSYAMPLMNEDYDEEMWRLNISDTNLRKSVWDKAYLGYIDFSGSDLSEAKFESTQIIRCNMLRCKLDNINLKGAVFLENEFSLEQLANVDMEVAHVQDVHSGLNNYFGHSNRNDQEK